MGRLTPEVDLSTTPGQPNPSTRLRFQESQHMSNTHCNYCKDIDINCTDNFNSTMDYSTNNATGYAPENHTLSCLHSRNVYSESTASAHNSTRTQRTHGRTLHGNGAMTVKPRTLSYLCGKNLFTTLVIFGVIFLLNGCSAAPTEFQFPDYKQGRYARDLSHFHISWPSLVDHQGQHVSYSLDETELHRRKRNAPSFSSPETPSSGEDVIHYKIPVDPQREVIVRVTHSDFLIAPSAVVERKVSTFRNVSDSEFSTLDHQRGCHFTGRAVDDESSVTALHTCGGLRGFLLANDEEYLIEPVKGHAPNQDGGRPHLVYKRSAIPEHLDFKARSKRSEPSCGVKEQYDEALKYRELWERKRRGATYREETAESSDGHRRHKRSISIERHVETLVVVDTDMVNYYENEDIETYVLTVMNMVASLFHDGSIGNAVNIAIVRIILMKDPDDNLKITHHADKTLKSFCKWQKTINFRDDDHPNHHDVALLLTRRNICSRMNEPCSTLGLAQVAGLCQPHRTCNINEDTGLSLAWTVAHELGHNFGMKHDNVHSDCMSDQDIQYVMAPHLTWDRTPSKWSECSRQAITKFLDRNWGYCLDDPPTHHDFQYPKLPAGTMYDADHQCRLLYGEGAERCNGIEVLENICTTLWCRVNNKCSTKLQAAAVGTICGTDKWCFAGQCVDIGERPQAIDGQWGEWAEWTSCTRTCGAGVSLSERHCNHPPPSNGGKYCTGERKRYRICNTDACDEEAPSFRATQCAEFNEIPYKGQMYEWEPVATPDTPCQLHCKPKDMYFSVLLKDIVTDGTPCVTGSRHMCISGRCRHIGCDWILDSSATEDRCGVCFGDGSTCTTIKEQYKETKKLGYVEATVIPVGARNIRVEEVADASNFLALRNDQGEYYLNGHWFIQWSGDYEVAGTVIHYKRIGNKEKFLAPGPLKEPLHIMLLMQTYNPGVEFEYTVPKENATDTRKPEFSWQYTDWSHCTVSCGGGTQRSAVLCKEQEAGLVDDRYCGATPKPDDKLRACNVHLCPARWWAGPWQHCSVTCGDKGIHRRTVICVRSLGSDEQIALEDQACKGLEKPVEVEPCNHKDPCPGLGKWVVEAWSNCTRPCNGGVQFRKVTCEDGSKCDEVKPAVKRPCNEQACPASTPLDILDISEGGVEGERNLPTPNHSSSSSSLSSSTPASSVDLSGIKEGGSSSSGDDLDKAVNIGAGANVNIGDKSSKNLDSLPDILNPKEGHIPDSYKKEDNEYGVDTNIDMSNIPEGGTDNENENQVPGVVEGGTQEEKEKAKEGEKNSEGAPGELQGNGDSAHIWQTLDWSRCSSECGNGVRTREVICVEAETAIRKDIKLCDLRIKPSAIQECFTSLCLEWQTGDWGQCSATCGYATQHRQVLCSNPGRCDMREKPSSVKVCSHLEPCVAWVYGDWSQCTKTCGTGIQERLVQCVNLTSQQLTQGCKDSQKPDQKQECNKEDCPADVNAALSVSCESNEMSYKVCRMLKKVGLCEKQYVKAKCCRTCQVHEKHKPDQYLMT